MKFFSWSDSYDHPDFERLLISARRQNIEIEAIGLGQSFRSMLTKNSTLLEAVSPLDEDQIVVSTDGHDVLYFAGIERIRERFLAFRSPIVYAAESMCAHIEAAVEARFPESPYPYRYLNAGTVVGYAGAIRRMLEEVADYRVTERLPHGLQDQTLLARYFVDHPDIVKLDVCCELFWCTGGEWDVFWDRAHLDQGRLFNNLTGLDPGILHVTCAAKRGLLREVGERAGITSALTQK